jgi:hypothetical protein
MNYYYFFKENSAFFCTFDFKKIPMRSKNSKQPPINFKLKLKLNFENKQLKLSFSSGALKALILRPNHETNIFNPELHSTLPVSLSIFLAIILESHSRVNFETSNSPSRYVLGSKTSLPKSDEI